MQIEVRYLNVHALNLSTLQYTELLSQVPQIEQDRIQRFHFEKDRLLSLMGILLVKHINNDSLIGWKRTELGKPYLENSNWTFSISHSGSYVIGAFHHSEEEREQLGVDLEEIKSIDKSEFHLVFRPEEMDRIKTEEDFYDLWTKKEAIMKALGTGFSLEPNQLQIDENNRCGFENKTWHLTALQINDQYRSHLCTASKPENICLERFDLFMKD